jgi:hypothetical protein
MFEIVQIYWVAASLLIIGALIFMWGFYFLRKPELKPEVVPELISVPEVVPELVPELISVPEVVPELISVPEVVPELVPELISVPKIKTITLTFNDLINMHIAEMDFFSRNVIA